MLLENAEEPDDIKDGSGTFTTYRTEYLINDIEKLRQDTLSSYKAHLIEEIEKIKEKVASTHGTNKYDGCYDDAISLIKE